LVPGLEGERVPGSASGYFFFVDAEFILCLFLSLGPSIAVVVLLTVLRSMAWQKGQARLVVLGEQSTGVPGGESFDR